MSRTDQEIIHAAADAWDRLEGRLDGALSTIKGISFREYRLLAAIADAPGGAISRVELAAAVGLTPSGATRALRPLEKLGVLTTVRGDRDARRALASLTPAGRDLLEDASGVVDDALADIPSRLPKSAPDRDRLFGLLRNLAA